MNTSPDQDTQHRIEQLIARSASALCNISPNLPTREAVEEIQPTIDRAVKRGYFLPDEDEDVRGLFSRYLTTRAALLSTLEDLKPTALEQLALPQPQYPEIFAIAYCTASLLVRSGRFLIDSYATEPVIWRKLDEAEPRFGIPRKQFTKIYRSLTSPTNLWIFGEATRSWQKNKVRIEEQLAGNATVKPILAMLDQTPGTIETSNHSYATSRLRYRLHSFMRRNRSGYKNVTFGLFRISGSLVAELRMKWKRKRVTRGVQRKIAKLLQPGDVLITRHDDAASNLFLPGFWPHAALVIGSKQQCQELGISCPDPGYDCGPDSVCVLEARKDGVLFRPLDDTLSVDAVTVIRPVLSGEEILHSLNQAVTHVGKPYDFEFDFRRSDKLVCTEVVYRAYHGRGPIRFELTPRMGRVCLSAEDVLDTAIDDRFFDVIAVYGVKGNRFATGQRANDLLIQSYRESQ